jgi:mRNA-degrading endonuclease toxin of MazEF toxin-antitoxin module
MDKDFDAWNTLKKSIQGKKPPRFFCEAEIWWCSIGLNVGTEEDGKNNLYERRVLVLKKFNTEQFLALPITDKPRSSADHFQLGEDSVILSQARVVSSRRLNRQVRFVNAKTFNEIKRAFKVSAQL